MLAHNDTYGMPRWDFFSYGMARWSCLAPYAAVAAHVRIHVLKHHGHWKSDTVYLYIVDGPEEQLGVSQAVLGSFVQSLRACAVVAGFVTESLRISMHGLLTKHRACCANNSS